MKKFFKIFLIFVGIIVLLFLIHMIKNIIILSNINATFSNIENIEDYSFKGYNDAATLFTEYYSKGNKRLLILEKIENGEKQKVSFYTNNYITNLYSESNNEKTVTYDISVNTKMNLNNIIESWELSGTSKLEIYFLTLIDSKKYNNKDCYRIRYIPAIFDTNATTYIDKSTGLYLKDFENHVEYSFEEIDDSIFIEPNSDEYKDISKSS